LLGKIGAPYTLLIDEFTYENCYISAFKEHEWFPGEFEFEISFVQDTAVRTIGLCASGGGGTAGALTLPLLIPPTFGGP